MTTAVQDVAGVLRAESERTQRALVEYLPMSGPRDTLYRLVADYPLRGGKGIRPALCLATCRAHGGDTEEALPSAVAIEMLHNAFLVHDDICDEAERRRGEPALHVTHGVAQALTAGNALAWMALEPLLRNVELLGAELALEVLAEFNHLTRRTIEGQAVELGWRTREDGIDTDAYLDLVLAKTCWYSAIHPCRVGALIGSRGTADLDAIADFGFYVGAVLQIRDDVENVTDRRSGKDFGGDVLEGKPTLLLTHLYNALSPAERAATRALVGPAGTASGVPAQERIARVVALMEEHGSVDYAIAFADGLAREALTQFERAMGDLPGSPDKDFVRDVVLYLRDPEVRGR
ncbi:MAG TPA: polyprenyl synthetase family protein [Solirubrobacteraceae bacterium]